ncbi:MAG: DUF5688 family protein [Lachnospiraceae bacterium]|nr:DUF5688 family protein [Lachnospiraceae bacterium]
MMNYEDFKNYIKDNILAELPDTYSEFEVGIRKTMKNNGLELDGLWIHGHDNIAPVIYLNGYYERYNDGVSIEDVMAEISEKYTSNVEHKGLTWDIMDFVTKLDNARDSIISRLVNTKNNAELLTNRPHKDFEDLSITYHIVVSRDENGIASVPITNELANTLGVTADDLDAIARENMHKNNPMVFREMYDLMREMVIPDIMEGGISREKAEEMFSEMFPGENDKMFVLSNDTSVNGAIWMTDPDTMKMVAEKMEGDFFVLPSSVHEVIIVPNIGYTSEELQEMVMSVNRGQVKPEDRLSDNVYKYDYKEHKLSLATEELTLNKSKEHEHVMDEDKKHNPKKH